MDAKRDPPSAGPEMSVAHSVSSPQEGGSWSTSKDVPSASGLAGLTAAVRAMRGDAAEKFTAALDLQKSQVARAPVDE